MGKWGCTRTSSKVDEEEGVDAVYYPDDDKVGRHGRSCGRFGDWVHVLWNMLIYLWSVLVRSDLALFFVPRVVCGSVFLALNWI